MDILKLVDGYEKRCREAEKHLTQLRKRAETIREVLTERESVQKQVDALDADIADFEQEREQLRSEWLEADFNDDIQAQREIKNRRAKLDQQIADAERTVRSVRDSVEAVDGAEVAEVRALLDSFKAPRYEELLAEIQDQLESAIRSLERLASDARSLLPSDRFDDKDMYTKVRSEHDTAYKRQQANERHLRKQEQHRRERLARYGNPSSTDGVHAALGTPRSLSGYDALTMTAD